MKQSHNYGKFIKFSSDCCKMPSQSVYHVPESDNGKVHAHGGTIELIKLRVMSDESIAYGQLCSGKFWGKKLKIRRKNMTCGTNSK